MKNKTLIVIIIVLTAVALALFAYAKTLEVNGGQPRAYTFPTAISPPLGAPTTGLVGGGWWGEMPTPISVESMPPLTVTPTVKP